MKMKLLLLFPLLLLVVTGCSQKRNTNIAEPQPQITSDFKKPFSSPEETFAYYLQAAKDKNFKNSDNAMTAEFQTFATTNQNYRARRRPQQLTNEYRYLYGKQYRLEMYDNRAIMRFSDPYARPNRCTS